MPGVEPDRTRTVGFQILPHQVHQRALAAAPSSVDGDDERRLRLVVAQEEAEAGCNRIELQGIGFAPFERLVRRSLRRDDIAFLTVGFDGPRDMFWNRNDQPGAE